jgi:hypothetical protein
MVDFGYTQTDTVLGKLTNGRKLVMTEIAILNAAGANATITVKPLQRIIGWTLGLAVPLTDTFVAAAGSTPNTILVTPTGDATGDTIQIFAVGV